VKMCL